MLAQWDAWRGGTGELTLVAACFDAPSESWAPELGELAEAKLRETISGTAVRASGFGDLAVIRSSRAGSATELILLGEGEARLDARARQGFTIDARGPVLSSCFVLCADASPTSRGPSRCAAAVDGAAFPACDGSPPPPSLALRAALSLVHHPNATAWGLALTAALAGMLAVATRRRPRRRA
jgi:hypothetical protein